MQIKEVTIITTDLQSALREGAQALGVPMNQLAHEELQGAPQGKIRVRVYVKESIKSEDIDRILDHIDLQIIRSTSQVVDSELKSNDDFFDENLNQQMDLNANTDPFEMQGDMDLNRCLSFEIPIEELYSLIKDSNPVQSQVQFAKLNQLDERFLKKLIHPELSAIEIVRSSTSDQKEGLFLKSQVEGWLVYANEQLRIMPKNCAGQFKIDIKSPLLATIQVFPSVGTGKAVTKIELTQLLKSKGICYGIQTQNFDPIIHHKSPEYAWSKPIEIAFGRPPTPSQDAQVQFLYPQKNNLESEFDILPDGRIDYKKVMNVPTIRRDSDIIKIIPGIEGAPGQDIYGGLISVDPPNQTPLLPGENVIVSEDRLVFKSAIDGMPVIHEDTISVYPQYTVKGNVDYHTGNIDFKGNVLIQGHVLPGFEVKANGDIIIQGNVESAVIQAGRNLLISGGVVGEAKAPIQCGGMFSCQFTQKAWIECIGDVVIHNSCMHSRIDTLGKLSLKSGKGTLVGGRVSAFRGGSIKQIGSNMGTLTKLTLGEDFLCKKRIKDEENRLSALQSSLSKLEDYLLPLLKKIGTGFVLQNEQKNRLKQIINKRDEITALIKKSNAKLKRIQSMAPESAECSLRVLEVLYSDVLLNIAGLPVAFNENQSRIILELDRKNATVVKKSLGMQKE